MELNQNGQPIKPVPRVLLDTLVAMARNSVGANTWRNFYLVVNDEKKDVTEDGENSCAFFISTLLRGLELMRTAHLRTESTVKDMLENGWYEIQQPQTGAVIEYTAKPQASGRVLPHIGICVSNTEVVSNSYVQRTPRIHQLSEGEEGATREIKAIYWHPRLDAPQLEQQRL